MLIHKAARMLLPVGLLLCGGITTFAQLDPEHRNQIELGVDQPLTGQGPQGIYAYYYYNNPEFLNSNIVLRAALAPAYLDSELGFKHLISPSTDVGLGISGGVYGDNYYEVRQGDYLQRESFDGHGGGASASIYQLLDPGLLIPLNVVARGGFHYATYSEADRTPDTFELPRDQVNLFTRAGLRLAGKEPVLIPNLGLELSVWFERQWRLQRDTYGFNNDRNISPAVNLYWVYAEMSYSWTNTGQKASVAVMAGDSSSADRFSAWRLGGVLPLVSEFPLMIPGYYYEELTVEKFVHLYGNYDIPLDRGDRWKFRVEAASANAKYLPGFEQKSHWQTGAGGGITFTPKSKRFSVIARYGYGFNAIRSGSEGSHSIGLLVQYDFAAHKKSSDSTQ